MDSRDELTMEKIFSQRAEGVRVNYEDRCLETLETALGYTPVCESHFHLGPDIATTRKEVLYG